MNQMDRKMKHLQKSGQFMEIVINTTLHHISRYYYRIVFETYYQVFWVEEEVDIAKCNFRLLGLVYTGQNPRPILMGEISKG